MNQVDKNLPDFLNREGKRMQKTKLLDTTLRDGEQTAGVVFSKGEKIYISQMLNEVGIEQIEVGIPAMGNEEKDTIKEIVKKNLSTSLIGWNRGKIEDIQHSIDCGLEAVAISIPTSDIHIEHKLKSNREKVMDMMVTVLEYSKKEGLYVSINAEDASRTEDLFLLEFFKAAEQLGANRVRISDTLGILNPISTFNKVKYFKENLNIEVEVHAHNDLGMATANAIAGAMAGADYLSVTVNGLGERAGNAALEEIIMALKYSVGVDKDYDMRKCKKLCEYVAKASNRFIPEWKAITGEKIFWHESGIHVDGVLKNPLTYEVMNFEDLGLKRGIILGKHTGTSAIKYKLLELTNEVVDDISLRKILELVKSKAIFLKRALSDEELLDIYEKL